MDQRISKISVLTFAVKISSPKNIISLFFLIISQPKLQIWNKTRPIVHSLQFGFQNFENKKSNFSQIPNLKTETKLSRSQTENLEKQIRKSPSKCYNSSNFVQNLEHKISNLAQIQKCPQNKTKNPSNPLSPILLPSRPRSPRLHETPEWTKLVSTRRKKSTARGFPIHTAVIYDLRLHVANLFIIKLTFLLRQDRKRPCR